jgi:hypothetical protein
MAIQPIDLQALFTQVDKVGKNEANQKEGLQVRQDIHAVHQLQKQEQRIQSVNQAQDTGQGAERIKDRNRRNHSEQEEASETEKENPEDEHEQAAISFVKDPALGQNIDVCG